MLALQAGHVVDDDLEEEELEFSDDEKVQALRMSARLYTTFVTLGFLLFGLAITSLCKEQSQSAWSVGVDIDCERCIWQCSGVAGQLLSTVWHLCICMFSCVLICLHACQVYSSCHSH